MPERSVRLRIDDMVLHIDMTERALKGVDRDAFDADFILQAAVIRFLEIIGEAANRVPVTLHALAPSVPWRQMIAMRNLIAHGYAEVDLDIVWATATTRLPQLRLQLADLLGRLPREED